jgi:methanogenic corrinoid protein MtbC1
MNGQFSEPTRIAHQDIKGVEPPLLENYPDAPVYEHTLILRLVNVRPIALWALEQHLGIFSGARGAAEQSGQKRRYSERDLVALLWLRERIVEGELPQVAGARLIAAQRQRNSGVLNSGVLKAPPGFSRPSGQLGAAQDFSAQNTPYPGFSPHARFIPTPTGSLAFGEFPSGSFPASEQPLDAGTVSGGSLGGSVYQGAPAYSADGQAEYPSGSWSDITPQYPATPRLPNPSNSLQRGPRDQAGQSVSQTPGPRIGGTSGRLGAVYSAPTPIDRPASGFDAARDQITARDLRWMVAPLMQAFSRFDTLGANKLVQQALEQCSVEVVCLGLVQPAIARISDLWSRNELTIPEERFAYSYLRGFLTSVFHSTMEAVDARLVVIGCAQRDANDLPALLLAVFWRRSGLRVIYLGADAGVEELARQRWNETPTLISLSVTSTQRIRSINRLAKQLRAQPHPHPDLCYTGALFARNADLQRKVNAIYLGDEPASATTAVRRHLGMIF